MDECGGGGERAGAGRHGEERLREAQRDGRLDELAREPPAFVGAYRACGDDEQLATPRGAAERADREAIAIGQTTPELPRSGDPVRERVHRPSPLLVGGL